MPALCGNQESAIRGKQKGQCSKGDACSFRHDDSQRGKKIRSSSPAPRSQTQSEGTVPIRHVIIGIRPYDKITNLNCRKVREVV